jgi:hypothetical protein
MLEMFAEVSSVACLLKGPALKPQNTTDKQAVTSLCTVQLFIAGP